ncbi:hypothetical protein TRFO_01398 [Tritrichomonas foetus]|uniref:Anaphase-promoting complex subunit 4 WD40 domain-containing protein n=1 Tax=Tritrichomonas foetus TaxID=1144522 RepID=A0A1J4K8C9_9EUKA|nr:hypothetical protein TRFO_01398 [Tritrichomonas foetus]|eukprot:OHT07226.1 hypothetical protein TRFO_01398 [Tritrichomonas foetus]
MNKPYVNMVKSQVNFLILVTIFHLTLQMSKQGGGANNFYKIDNQFKDTISDLVFGNGQRYLAATSWDGIITVWEFPEDYSQATEKYRYADPQKNAFLRCCFNEDCSDLFFGDSQGQIFVVKLNEPNLQGKPPHKLVDSSNTPIVGLCYCVPKSQVVLLKLNKQLQILDTQMITIELTNKPICMSISGTILYVAMLGPSIVKIDLNTRTLQQVQTSHMYQIRSISVSPTKPDYYISGSIYGQVEICAGSNRTILPCHRTDQTPQIWASNSVAMHPNQPFAISAGGDGTIKMINLEKGRPGREQKMSNNSFPLTTVAISSNGEVAAIAQGYDWSRGAEKYLSDKPELQLYIRKMANNEFG